ncbi:hypothetical protein DRE_04156 [Drechslerella stenobrocha 248]|uniref:Uncharacterized protein n=1 Tax=Drechslerella stenobrocha 248 TaxID=1043628 RepID=W7HTH0_9PEZI|nr:hypothetical protein DRE_04156 [Drechslerella stenobrocha 248]
MMERAKGIGLRMEMPASADETGGTLDITGADIPPRPDAPLSEELSTEIPPFGEELPTLEPTTGDVQELKVGSGSEDPELSSLEEILSRFGFGAPPEEGSSKFAAGSDISFSPKGVSREGAVGSTSPPSGGKPGHGVIPLVVGGPAGRAPPPIAEAKRLNMVHEYSARRMKILKDRAHWGVPEEERLGTSDRQRVRRRSYDPTERSLRVPMVGIGMGPNRTPSKYPPPPASFEPAGWMEQRKYWSPQPRGTSRVRDFGVGRDSNLYDPERLAPPPIRYGSHLDRPPKPPSTRAETTGSVEGWAASKSLPYSPIPIQPPQQLPRGFSAPPRFPIRLNEDDLIPRGRMAEIENDPSLILFPHQPQSQMLKFHIGMAMVFAAFVVVFYIVSGKYKGTRAGYGNDFVLDRNFRHTRSTITAKRPDTSAKPSKKAEAEQTCARPKQGFHRLLGEIHERVPMAERVPVGPTHKYQHTGDAMNVKPPHPNMEITRYPGGSTCPPDKSRTAQRDIRTAQRDIHSGTGTSKVLAALRGDHTATASGHHYSCTEPLSGRSGRLIKTVGRGPRGKFQGRVEDSEAAERLRELLEETLEETLRRIKPPTWGPNDWQLYAAIPAMVGWCPQMDAAACLVAEDQRTHHNVQNMLRRLTDTLEYFNGIAKQQKAILLEKMAAEMERATDGKAKTGTERVANQPATKELSKLYSTVISPPNPCSFALGNAMWRQYGVLGAIGYTADIISCLASRGVHIHTNVLPELLEDGYYRYYRLRAKVAGHSGSRRDRVRWVFRVMIKPAFFPLGCFWAWWTSLPTLATTGAAHFCTEPVAISPGAAAARVWREFFKPPVMALLWCLFGLKAGCIAILYFIGKFLVAGLWAIGQYLDDLRGGRRKLVGVDKPSARTPRTPQGQILGPNSLRGGPTPSGRHIITPGGTRRIIPAKFQEKLVQSERRLRECTESKHHFQQRIMHLVSLKKEARHGLEALETSKLPGHPKVLEEIKNHYDILEVIEREEKRERARLDKVCDSNVRQLKIYDDLMQEFDADFQTLDRYKLAHVRGDTEFSDLTPRASRLHIEGVLAELGYQVKARRPVNADWSGLDNDRERQQEIEREVEDATTSNRGLDPSLVGTPNSGETAAGTSDTWYPGMEVEQPVVETSKYTGPLL